MLLCSENTASTADSTQNKIILYQLSENLCLQQRRKAESRCLLKHRFLRRYLDQSNECLVTLLMPLNSKQPRGDGMCVWQILSPHCPRQCSPRSRADTCSKRGPPCFSYAREIACSSSWQLLGLLATGSCFAFLKEKLWQK